MNTAAAEHPHSYFPDAQPQIGTDPACTSGDIDPLVDCMAESCGDTCLDGLVDCVLSNCPFEFLRLPDDCTRCAQANIGGDVEAIRATCTTETTEYAYDGSFGTGILSRGEITSVEEKVFASTTNRRSALHAVVEAPAGPIDVYCTHLTAVFSTIPYPRAEGSWAEEQAVQIDELLTWIDETATTGRTAVMGDMNTGPAVGDSIAEVPENWELFEAAAMEVPYVAAAGECTFCPDNGLLGADSDEEGVVIDHVLLEGFEGTATATRVLDEVVDVETCGETIDGALSDHYGVRIAVE